jgi:two-component system, NtrC family, sensor kinase
MTGRLGERERILIVDDSAVVRKSFQMQLRDRYDCSEARNVLEALELLKRETFELVITDVIMPGLSGIELLRKVIETFRETAVIVVSGVDRPQRALDAVRSGAFDYLIKPCDPETLWLTVERALERRNLLVNAARYKRDLEQRNEELVRGKAQLQRLQAQIVQTEKMASIGQLAAGIAHEINNPVGFVYGNLDFLEESTRRVLDLVQFYENVEMPPEIAAAAADYKQKMGCDRIAGELDSIMADCRNGLERVRDIVQNLRTFSRLDEAEFKQTDIHEGLESTVRLLSRYFSSGNIRLVRDLDPELPAVDGYSAQLNQVWMNLLANAAQAIGKRPGEVRVCTRREGDHVVVAISDNGCGIEKANLGKIFDPFFTTKPVGEGTGLGLAIIFGIVQRHNGRIDVESEVGRGSTFTVRLPISDRGPVPEAIEQATPKVMDHQKVRGSHVI